MVLITGPCLIFKTYWLLCTITLQRICFFIYTKKHPPQATADIEEALKNDWTLREKLEVLKKSMERLDSIKVSPRTEVILDVLKYASREEDFVKVK